MTELLLYKEIRKVNKRLKQLTKRINKMEVDLRAAISELSTTVTDGIGTIEDALTKMTEPDVTPAESLEMANQIRSVTSSLKAEFDKLAAATGASGTTGGDTGSGEGGGV